VNTTQFRPRSATELVDATIQLYRARLPAFLTLGAALYVPLVIVQWLLPESGAGAVVSGLLFGTLSLLWGAACYAVIIVFVSDLYTTGQADVALAIERARPRMVAAVGASVLAIIGAGVGFLLLIVPGFLLILAWFAIPAAALLEQPLDAITALKRSAVLSRNLKGHIGICFTILGLITGAIGLLATLLGGGVALLLHGSPEGTLRVVQLVTSIVRICLGTLTPIMATLLYYDARIRNEGYDIELMAQRVGGAAAPPPASAPAY
jgi:hypothetical protein